MAPPPPGEKATPRSAGSPPPPPPRPGEPTRPRQPVLDELPDDPRHLVAVELDDGIGYLDLGHATDFPSLLRCALARRAVIPGALLRRSRQHQASDQQADGQDGQRRHVDIAPPAG